ncbi:MAG: hypothetical protein AAFR87_02520 [Bacteroidota bacterium]
MKLFKYAMVVLFVVKMATALANDSTTRVIISGSDPMIKVQAVKGDRYRIFFQGEQMENVWLRIYDKYREKLYSEEFKSTLEFAKLYDFANLPDGEYYIEFSGKGWRKTEKLEILRIKNQKDFTAQLTTFEGSGKVLLQIDNPEIQEVYVYVEDKRGAVMFDDSIELNKDGSRTFRFDGFAKGTYTFRVYAGETTQTEQLSLN